MKGVTISRIKEGDDTMGKEAKEVSSKDIKITYRASVEFEGPIEEFEKVMAGLGRLQAQGLMIGTWPTPEHPARGMMIDTVPLPELEIEGLMIGTWPTPEHPAGGLMIDTVPLPEEPPPGISAVTRLFSTHLLDKIAEGMPRLKINKGINGGIRNPHFHVANGVVLLDRARFKQLVGQVAEQLAKDLLKEEGMPRP